MAATVSKTKTYFVGPQDGWFQIIDATTTNLVFLRMTAVPHTHPFYVYSNTSAPTLGVDAGVYVCHHPFKIANYSNNNASKFWIRVVNPVQNSQQSNGKLRIDVYADGGVLQ
jgi:hypothetical protein